MEQLRIGVIGVGRFGRLHIKVLKGLAGCKVTAISDVDDDLLKKAGEEFNVGAVFKDAFELIKHPDVDVIDIVSNEDTHGPFAIEAIKHGNPMGCIVKPGDVLVDIRA